MEDPGDRTEFSHEVPAWLLHQPVVWWTWAPTTMLQVCGCHPKTAWWFQTLFIFTPNHGEMIQFDEQIFQMVWNHQLDNYLDTTFPCCWGLTVDGSEIRLSSAEVGSSSHYLPGFELRLFLRMMETLFSKVNVRVTI